MASHRRPDRAPDRAAVPPSWSDEATGRRPRATAAHVLLWLGPAIAFLLAVLRF